MAGIASNLVYNNVFTGGVVNPCSRWYSPYSYFASESVNGINTNPLLNLTNPLAPKISAASPCKYAGKFSGYLTDFRGRPFNNPPTIGPFEFTSRSKRY